MTEPYDVIEVIDSSGQMITYDTATRLPLPWPTEDVRKQVSALCSDRPTMAQLLNYHGILVTTRQRDLLEAWINSPARNEVTATEEMSEPNH